MYNKRRIKEAQRAMPQKNEDKTPIRDKVLTIAGVVVCVILIPILIANLTLNVKCYIYKDEVPGIRYAPL